MFEYRVYDQILIGPFIIHTWGLCVGLAFTVSLFFFLKQAKKNRLDSNQVFYFSIIVFLAGFFGSFLSFNGQMLFSGILASWLVGWWLIKKLHWDYWLIADLAAPAVALGLSIGRLGCLLVNDHQGAITNLPWAIKWPDGSWRHPVALYLIIADFLIFCLLQLIKKNVQPGRIFIFWLLLLGLSRFFLDFTRTTKGPLADLMINYLFVSQWISLGLIIYAIILINYGKKLA